MKWSSRDDRMIQHEICIMELTAYIKYAFVVIPSDVISRWHCIKHDVIAGFLGWWWWCCCCCYSPYRFSWCRHCRCSYRPCCRWRCPKTDCAGFTLSRSVESSFSHILVLSVSVYHTNTHPYTMQCDRPVWPDVEIKSSRISPKGCPKK